MVKVLQLSCHTFFMVKISSLYEKKTVSDKPWKNMLRGNSAIAKFILDLRI